MIKEHELKVWPEFFDAMERGLKNFEIRTETDRNFAVGDILILRWWNPQTQHYNGKKLYRRVTYLLRGSPFLPPHVVVMSLEDRVISSYKNRG